ncbi:GntR family transcriptional regulator [Salibacterium halotolerans]|uniref:DNA-binding transcriptional regulator YhcF, GntR family n=1 Tax=Salibacterium halotolerans TaxID=1884432 RepID=A0A1I5S9C8_9BACI|nr:GntR family transcriptional regulator [Salibacterium halotolerans]SFP67321.1 DNA-binding transcriptional regulator YhcF, GntR family [Salibacterium halotolerans]
MIFSSDDSRPIYLQIAEWIEAEILKEQLRPHDHVYSQYKLAERFTINPATAAKGLTKLAEEGILYDRRGMGKFVAEEAREKVIEKRRSHTLKKMISDLVQEADRLDVPEEELMQMVREERKKQ